MYEIRFEANVTVRSLVQIEDTTTMGELRTKMIEETERMLALDVHSLSDEQVTFSSMSTEKLG